jgi:RNA polymerase sigma-70 factor (ECF subfamily)
MSPTDLAGCAEEALVERFRAGEQVCFAELYQRLAPKVLACCLAFLRNRTRAEEVTQETFVRAYERIEQFQGGVFQAWVCAIARNLCLNHLKSRANAAVSLPDGDPPAPHLSENDLALADQVAKVLDALPENQRVALELFHVEGYTYEEIADLTGFSDTEVKSFLQNGRRMFRLHWERLRAGGK